MNTAFLVLQRCLPKRLVSALTGYLTRIRGGILTYWAIRVFVRAYGVNLAEAETPDPRSFNSFNAFFTRALRAGARPLPARRDAVCSPADGTVSAAGMLAEDRIIQAKGMDYSLLELLDGDSELARRFHSGAFITIYLAPYNYHRVHMPLDGAARYLRHIPGDLYSVNATTARGLPRLFCRNERVVVSFDSDAGCFALVMVGALNVGSIELTLPAGAPFRNRPETRTPPHQSIALNEAHLSRGAEFGRFNMGSTVILLASPGLLSLDAGMECGRTLVVGETIATLTSEGR